MAHDGRFQYVDQILQAIDYGNITYAEAERRLQTIIDDETSQSEHPVDPDLLVACQSLLFQLHTHGSMVFESHMNENLLIVKKRYAKLKQNVRTYHQISRVVAAIVVLCVFLGLGGSLHLGWFTESTTPDEQQHIVQGHDLRIDLINQAIAEHSNMGTFDCTEISELQDHLGFDPHIAEVLGEQWKVNGISVYYFPTSLQIVVTYTDELHARRLVHTQFCFTDYDDASISFEQNKEGNIVTCDSLDLYCSDNEERTMIMWVEHGTVYYLSGDFDQAEGLILTNEIRRMYDEE